MIIACRAILIVAYAMGDGPPAASTAAEKAAEPTRERQTPSWFREGDRVRITASFENRSAQSTPLNLTENDTGTVIMFYPEDNHGAGAELLFQRDCDGARTIIRSKNFEKLACLEKMGVV